jgi:hypothetical protein
MELFDIFGLVLIIMAAVVSVVASFYAYVHYAEPREKGFRGMWLIRALIVLGLSAIFFVNFLVPFDIIANYEEYAN